MTLNPSARRARSRWMTLITVVASASLLLAGTVLAVDTNNPPTFTFTPDALGADDQPGQKDLSAQSAVSDGTGFWVAWKWDVTSLSGKNTGDGCALFTTDTDGNVDAALCVTIGQSPATQLSTRLYTCGDNRVDRCTSPVLVGADSDLGSVCTISTTASDPFHPTQSDTQATCHVDLTEINATSATLVNTCSYPSQEPNSDPSDCVVIISISTSLSTDPDASITWSVTLSDQASITPSAATGTVEFKLYLDSDPNTPTGCDTLLWTKSATISSGVASSGTTGGTNATGTTGNVVSTAGTYYWTATYSGGGDYTASSSACGEAQVVTAPTVVE